MNICIGFVCLLVLDRRKHDDGGSGSACALLGEGVFVSRENFRMVERERKGGEGQGEGNLDSGESVVGLCCSRTSTETKLVITTEY